MMMTLPASFYLLGHHILEQRMDGGGSLVEWCSSTTLTFMILGGVELQGIEDGRGLLDACRMVELSGVMVTSTAGLARSMR
jgi:hypothetical protein